MRINKTIVKYQRSMIRRKQLEENGLLNLTGYLITDDYKGFEKYISEWAEKHNMSVIKAAYIFSKFEDDFIELQQLVMKDKHKD